MDLTRRLQPIPVRDLVKMRWLYRRLGLVRTLEGVVCRADVRWAGAVVFEVLALQRRGAREVANGTTEKFAMYMVPELYQIS